MLSPDPIRTPVRTPNRICETESHERTNERTYVEVGSDRVTLKASYRVRAYGPTRRIGTEQTTYSAIRSLLSIVTEKNGELSTGSTKGPPDMHDHRYCEQQIAAAIRTNNTGRAEYLSTRCDREHGDLSGAGEGVRDE